MKIGFVALWIIVFTSSQTTLKELRTNYAMVGVDEKYVREIIRIANFNDDAIVMAYAAGAEMASAQYKFSPLNKLSAFNSGRLKLDLIVKNNLSNIEIRFIRYSVQLKCPRMLGYNKELKSDRAFIIQRLPEIRSKDQNLYSYILSFILLHDSLNEEEKKNNWLIFGVK